EVASRCEWSVSYTETQHPPVKFVVCGGDCSLTPARVVVEAWGGVDRQAKVRLYPKEITHPVPGVDYLRLMLEPGDGSVTKASLLARESLNPTVSRSEDVYFTIVYF